MNDARDRTSYFTYISKNLMLRPVNKICMRELEQLQTISSYEEYEKNLFVSKLQLLLPLVLNLKRTF